MLELPEPLSARLETEKIKIYPNPSQGVFELSIPLFWQGAHLKLFDLSGNEILSRENIKDNYVLDLSQEKHAVYLLLLSKNMHHVSYKLIKY